MSATGTGAGGPPMGAGASAGGSTSRTVSPTGATGRRSAAVFDSMEWKHGVRFDRRSRKCMRYSTPEEPLPSGGSTYQSIKRLADATPKGKFETKTGQVKDRTVVHSAAVVAAMSLPAGAIRNSIQMTAVNKDCDHREALLGSVIDTEVSKLVNKVSHAAVETGCVPIHAHMAASVAFGAPCRKALDVSRAGAVNTLRVALDKAWDGALPFPPAGGAGVDDGSDDDDPEDDDEDEEEDEE